MTTDAPMQLGMVGLGRMGANIVRRIMRDGHSAVVNDVSADAVEALKADGESVVGFQCNAITWAEDEKTLSKYVSAFSRAVQSWGVCDLTDSVGDPVPSFFATVPAGLILSNN